MGKVAPESGLSGVLGWTWAFAVLLPIRLLSATHAPIMDCDETFNYWEPLRYLSYHGKGGGMQTWEYSPAFALRSYLYLELHKVLLAIGQLAMPLDDVQSFYWLRCCLAVLSAACEAAFCSAVSHRLSPRTGVLLLYLMAPASGLFHASVALLPSTTCMYCVLLGFAAWLNGCYRVGLLCGSFAVLLAWPFAALAFVPMGLDALRPSKLGFLGVLCVATAALLLFGALPAAFDGWYYGTGKPVSAFLNILLYNALGQGGGGQGADLYGTEPASFYVKNLLLNFNAAALLFALAAPLLALSGRWRALLFTSPAYVVLLLFSAMAHKEERFLTPVYPVFCLGAAAALDTGLGLVEGLATRCCMRGGGARYLGNVLGALAVLVVGGLSVSRSLALNTNFTAPLQVYETLYRHSLAFKAPARAGSVCIGKEWYRFPSSFFLPRFLGSKSSSPLLWLDSSFGGQLPQPFQAWPAGLSSVPPHMNDRNQKEMSRFSKISDCDFVVDLELPHQEEPFLNRSVWEPLSCEPFLDSERSRLPWRAFHLPFGMSERRNSYAEYCVFQRRADGR